MNLKKQDRILFINNENIHNSSSFRNNLQKVLKNSESFQVTFLRGNQTLSLNYQSSSLGKGKYKVKIQNQKAQRQIASVTLAPKSSTPLEKSKNKTKAQSKKRQNTSTNPSSVASSSKKPVSSQKTSSQEPSSQEPSSQTSSSQTSSQKPTSQKASSQKTSSQKPSSQKPSSQKPSSQTSSSQTSSSQKPSSQTSSSQTSSSQKPSSQTSSSQTSSSQKPSSQTSSSQTSSSQKASSQTSSSQKPSSQKASSQTSSSQTSSSQKPSSQTSSSQTSSSQKASSKKSSSRKSKKSSPTKNLIPEKLKDQFQRAYISRSNSFVYAKPDFDSSQLRPLSIGKLVLISRKIYLPHHSFGSFYRIFLFRPKKLIGYISEAEVIPEFRLNQGVYTINPNYNKAKKYKTSRQTLKIQELENSVTTKQRSKIQKEMKKRIDSHQANSKNYYGVFLGASSYLNNLSPSQSQRSPLLGFKASSYRSKINFDISLNMYLKDIFFIEKVSFDFLIGLPFIKTSSYSLFTSAGVFVEYQPTSSNTVSFDLGPTVSTSLLIPINKKLLVNLSAKGNYQSLEKLLSLKLLAGLQLSF